MNETHAVYTRFDAGPDLKVWLEGTLCRVAAKEGIAASFTLELLGDRLSIRPQEGLGAAGEKTSSPSLSALLAVCEYAFTRMPTVKSAIIPVEAPLERALLEMGFEPTSAGVSMERQGFFQLALPWHRRGGYRISPERWVKTGEVSHPLRPAVPQGVLYRRLIPSLGQELSFEHIAIERHLDIFHSWQNDRRVAHFWEMAHSKDELKGYLEKVQADPHHAPLIACLNGEPAGYFEIYWTPEDRLGPYYDAQPFDRGFHFLIGSRAHLGRERVGAFLESIVHFLFLDDARTRTILAEPRADNAALLAYLKRLPYWEKRFEFDFPHKHAALLACRREDFFSQARFL